MLHPSPRSRSTPDPRPALGRASRLAFAASLLALATWVPEPTEAVPLAEPDAPGEASCEPFEGEQRFAQLALASEEPGVEPADPESAAIAGQGGRIVTLPSAGGGRDAGQVSGEAILALPKGGSREFELGAGARVAESYWSPVLCATVARVKGPEGAAPEELVPKSPDTAALVPNHVYSTAAGEVAPLAQAELVRPDPYRPLQWGVEQSGVERARSLSNGAGVRVAILDSAPQTDHRDLGEVRVVPVEGGPAGDRPAAHGTLVTGLVDAIEGNGFGIAGLAPGVELVSVPVCTPVGDSANDRCPLFTVLRGLDAAWNEEASVVNLSIVGPDNPLLRRGTQRLDELGVLIVAAAGNEGTREPRYPAAYPAVIGVGALDRDGRIYARSNRAPSAEILAPGVEVLSSVPGNAFSFGSGTSFAAAHVTGSLAILLGAGVEPAAARQALFQQAAERPTVGTQPPPLPRLCDVLSRLGRACPGERG